ncbi:carotenoid oxygenase family protein [Variovorax rhizosphaerae]|uniref:Carotenoid oxygenase family protein n=1 Tax=Variovorax rhizosphaerae TaxID=1836200 RepID=A0ABU8WN04_9BURK
MNTPPTTAAPSLYGSALAIECDAAFLPVQGELPEGLDGTLYRNGPNPQFPDANAHLFGGDGMLHAFTLDGGKASYRNRWVRTAHWQAERAAGHRLFDAYGRNLDGSSNESVADEGAANTNVVWYAGRLLALEEAHLPVEIDPVTLLSRGQTNFGGALVGPFTAHPKMDPATGELLFFGYNATGPLSAGMSHGSIDTAGRVSRFERFDAPYASMVHDFAVTGRHLLFPILPLTGSMTRMQQGRPPYAWEPELGARVGVLKRGAPVEQMRWFEGDSGYVFHVMNAWEEGERIVADVMRYDEPPLFPHPDGRPTDPSRSVARLCRWTFDLAGESDRFTQTPMDDLATEFPRFDERYSGLQYRHGWAACQREAVRGAGYEGLVHYDLASGKRNLYWLPAGDRISEPVFVPRADDAAEGDGWLLAVAWRAGQNRSELAVFNAGAIADGPVATVQLPHRVPAGFHGNWVAGQFVR